MSATVHRLVRAAWEKSITKATTILPRDSCVDLIYFGVAFKRKPRDRLNTTLPSDGRLYSRQSTTLVQATKDHDRWVLPAMKLQC
jgi:hypothetical protein